MSQLTLQAQIAALAGIEHPAGIELATLTRYDIPALASLYLVAYDSPEIAENLYEAVDEMRMSFDGAFGQPLDNSFIGAWVDGELVGAILVTIDPPWDDVEGPFIIDMTVLPEYRGRGIATALIGEASERIAQAGYETIGLRVDLHQAAAAARLYNYLGFEEVPR